MKHLWQQLPVHVLPAWQTVMCLSTFFMLAQLGSVHGAGAGVDEPTPFICCCCCCKSCCSRLWHLWACSTSTNCCWIIRPWSVIGNAIAPAPAAADDDDIGCCSTAPILVPAATSAVTPSGGAGDTCTYSNTTHWHYLLYKQQPLLFSGSHGLD